MASDENNQGDTFRGGETKAAVRDGRVVKRTSGRMVGEDMRTCGLRT
jgi:hypothetical protein